MNPILAGAIGGIMTGILIPALNYFGQRVFNNLFLRIYIDETDPLNLRVHSSVASLTNAIAYISIENTKDDIFKSTQIPESFCVGKVEEDRLSWSRNNDDSNFSEICINPGESQKLNLIRVHEENGFTFIEVASEQGFYPTAKKSRINLNSNQDYKFEVKITASNLLHKKKKFIYKYLSKSIAER